MNGTGRVLPAPVNPWGRDPGGAVAAALLAPIEGTEVQKDGWIKCP